MMPRETTKKCPVCGATNLILIATQNHKVCMNHKPKAIRIPWYLDKDQRSLL